MAVQCSRHRFALPCPECRLEQNDRLGLPKCSRHRWTLPCPECVPRGYYDGDRLAEALTALREHKQGLRESVAGLIEENNRLRLVLGLEPGITEREAGLLRAYLRDLRERERKEKTSMANVAISECDAPGCKVTARAKHVMTIPEGWVRRQVVDTVPALEWGESDFSGNVEKLYCPAHVATMDPPLAPDVVRQLEQRAQRKQASEDFAAEMKRGPAD